MSSDSTSGRQIRIGENLRRIRESRGVGRAELADALRVDEDYIARIEALRIEPQVSDLLKLAAALDTDIAALIYGKEFGEKKAILTRSDSRVRIERARYLEYESLAPRYAGRHIEPFLVRIQRRDPELLEYSRHVGEEFHYLLEGTLKIVVDEQEYVLQPGDTFYFDSSLSHAVAAVSESASFLAAIYYGETMLHMTRGRKMRDLIQAAKVIGGRNLAVVCPDTTSIEAVNRGIEEGIIDRAFLFGSRGHLPASSLRFGGSYEWIEIDIGRSDYEEVASRQAVESVHSGDTQMLMKGRVNTAVFVKAVLDRDGGISTGRRLSLVSIFELPDVDRLIFLTDPGINPELMRGDDLQSSVDIINNAIDVARSMGVATPKVALMDANEIPSPQIPSTMFEKQLSEMSWDGAVVYGPLSYDLALYKEAAAKKELPENLVAGKADILVVPYISAGNFLYKAWAMTMDAEVANVVIGARVPVIITSRSDSDMVKFLTICASAIYSQHLLNR